jgi:hypothetical protein
LKIEGVKIGFLAYSKRNKDNKVNSAGTKWLEKQVSLQWDNYKLKKK